jgi:enterochelin esterase-like enzyme
MKSLQFRGLLLGPALVTLFGSASCGSGAMDHGGTAGAFGSAGAGDANDAAVGTAGASGAPGSAGATGTAGASATAGATGSAGATDAATTGTAGDGGGADATGVPGSTMGTQDDPGTTGDGTVPLPGPYTLPPEATSHLNGAPTGQLLGPFMHKLTGTYTGWTANWIFTYWVYVPAQYKAGHAAALAVFGDGEHYIGMPALSDARFNAPTVFDNLIADGSMPVTIGVFIYPGSSMGQIVGGGDGGRSKQYDTPNDQYGKFLLQEFLPTEILAKYTIVTDADGWAIGGHSSGGIAAFSAAWFYTDNFHKVITASPSFSNTGGYFPAKILTVTPGKPIRVYHLAGTMDLCCPSWYDENNQAAMDFMKMGYHYRYRPGTGMHFPPAEGAQDFPDALRWLWRGYHTPP